MNKKIKKYTFGLIPFLLLAMSCAPKVPAPGPEIQTLLVIPVEIENTSGYPFGFGTKMYVAKIEDTKKPPDIVTEFIVKPSNAKYNTVTDLPPGFYRVFQEATVTLNASGQKNYSPIKRAIDISFEMKKGAVTFFRWKYRFHQYTSGRGYQSRIYSEVFDKAYKEEVIEELKKEENFSAWTLD